MKRMISVALIATWVGVSYSFQTKLTEVSNQTSDKYYRVAGQELVPGDQKGSDFNCPEGKYKTAAELVARTLEGTKYYYKDPAGWIKNIKYYSRECHPSEFTASFLYQNVEPGQRVEMDKGDIFIVNRGKKGTRWKWYWNIWMQNNQDGGTWAFGDRWDSKIWYRQDGALNVNRDKDFCVMETSGYDVKVHIQIYNDKIDWSRGSWTKAC